MSQAFAFSTVDVFTLTPFKGNQLAIVHLPHNSNLSQDVKQSIAREFNFSESVFLYDAAPGTTERRLDIFIVSAELPFAGHPVIGTICYVCQREEPPFEDVRLLTKAGPILGRYNWERKLAEAEIPHNVKVHKALGPRRAILACQEALGPVITTGPDLPVVSIVRGMTFVLVELPSDCLERLKGDCQRFDEDAVVLDDEWGPSFVGVYYYVIVSQESTIQLQVRRLGQSIEEDAATGSAASALAAYLALKDGKGDRIYEFSLEQGVQMGRASYINVKVELETSGRAVKSIVLAGSAVLVTEGKLQVPAA